MGVYLMKLIIAANWKMHKTAAEACEFCRAFKQAESRFQGVEVVICPPFTALPAVAAELKGSPVKLGAQNMHWEPQGAYTGEIAASMLLEHGVEYVIIGHSERRQLMGETDSDVRKKLKAALESGLKPILCVGETEKEREKGSTEAVLKKQLSGALEGLSPADAQNLVIAYEPVWAIGTGRAASADDAREAAVLIQGWVREALGEKAAAGLRIQYGGSVKAENIGSFVTLASIHGALVGGAGLEADSFSALVEAAGKGGPG
jgi:triosephosphate isomerase (TIM)